LAFENTFQEVTIILSVATLVGFLGIRLRQPLITSFIAVGVLLGPCALNVASSHEHIELLAKMGIALLLFIVGLKLDLHLIRTMGPVALATGLGQVLFTSFFGFLIALGFGMSFVGAAYTATALTFSSTIIIVKLLSDKREIDSLHGRIAVGFLIVQDILVVLAMIGLSTLGSAGDQGKSLATELPAAAGKAALFIALLAGLMRTALPTLLEQIARSQELLTLFSIAWATALAGAGEALGFSAEVGAFLAGVALASTNYREAISSRLVSVRDFLLLFFFIDLGARLELSTLDGQLFRSAVFSLFVLVGNPLIVMIIMGIMGYRRRTGFLAGLTVAQISEFSLILASLGLGLGHIDKATVGLITLVGIVTIGISTYMILFSGFLYHTLSPWLSIFERKNAHRESDAQDLPAGERIDVILFGLGRYGASIATHLLARGRSVMAVDFDPETLAYWRAKGLRVLYGDALDPEIWEHLPLHDARWVVSAMPTLEANLTLLKVMNKDRARAKIVVTAHDEGEEEILRKAGAGMILRPFVDASEQAVDSLTEAMYTLPGGVLCSDCLTEVRVPSGSLLSGKSIDQVPLRSEHGVTILAVSRGGRSFFDPGPDFTLFPGDRLVLLGRQENLERAKNSIMAPDERVEGEPPDTFVMGFLEIPADSPWIGKTIAQLRFRSEFGLTVITVKRGETELTPPSPGERIEAGDVLITAGTRRAAENLNARFGRTVIETLPSRG
jgi:Kef-type K+ transport system membrane component KefB/Trk K+ transport system NAD-binding subunit